MQEPKSWTQVANALPPVPHGFGSGFFKGLAVGICRWGFAVAKDDAHPIINFIFFIELKNLMYF
jgi:hypothetical protein